MARTVLIDTDTASDDAVALIMALEGKPVNAYIDEALLPKVVDSTGTIIIDKTNADKYTPNY